MTAYRRAIELDPSGGPAHHHLGLCWRDKGRLDEAMAEFRRAIELDPKAALAHFQLGLCWQAKGQLDEAMTEFRRAIELDPKGARAHHHLGLCWRDKGRLDEAMAEFRRAIELDPEGGGRGPPPPRHVLAGQGPGSTRRWPSSAAPSSSTPRGGIGPPAASGCAGRTRGRLDEAMAEFCLAIESRSWRWHGA